MNGSTGTVTQPWGGESVDRRRPAPMQRIVIRTCHGGDMERRGKLYICAKCGSVRFA